MIPIGNDGLAMPRIPEQQEGRDRLLKSDESAISIHMDIAAAEQSQSRGTENVFGSKFSDWCMLQSCDKLFGNPWWADQAQV